MQQSNCPSGHSPAEHDAYLEHFADVVVRSAFAAHPEGGQAAADCALALVDSLMVPAVLEECGRPEPSEAPERIPVIGTFRPELHGSDSHQAARDMILTEGQT